VRPICALGDGAGTGLPAILLGSKIGRCRLGRAGASPFSLPTPKLLSGPLSGSPVEMLALNPSDVAVISLMVTMLGYHQPCRHYK
jgi:hypothetical protein